jgi:hypothetical protein
MLENLHDAIRALLHGPGGLSPEDVDVRFEAPTKDWTVSLFRPTVNLFLYDVQENLELRYTSFQTRRDGSRAFTKADPRLFDFRYMVSAVSSEIRDEHAILFRVLQVLLARGDLAVDAGAAAPVTALCRVDQPSETSSRLTDLWSALDVAPRPAIAYVLTLPVDTETTFEAPLVLTRGARYRGPFGAAGPEARYHIGGVVRGPGGAPVPGASVALEGTSQSVLTDPEGRFVFLSVPAGAARLRVASEAASGVFERVVPSDGYDVELNQAGPGPGNRR